MEVLNALISEADRRRVLSPLLGDAVKYRASVYADDVPTMTSRLCKLCSPAGYRSSPPNT